MTLARTPLGTKDILVTGAGSAADALNLAAAESQLNAWGEGRLLIDGHVIVTSSLNFVGDISVEGVNSNAILDIRTTSGHPFNWNSTYNPKAQTTYAFTQDAEFADYFSTSATTFNDGDWVCMWSDDKVTDNASHSGFLGSGVTWTPYYTYLMEIHQVHEWDAVNTRAYTADPIVYHMQTTPLFCKMSPSKNIAVKNLQIVWGGGTDPADFQRVLNFNYCAHVRVSNIHFPRNGPGTIHFQYCMDCKVDGLSQWGMSNTTSGWDGTYGVVAGVTNGVRVTNSYLIGSRHGFTTASSTYTVGGVNHRQGFALNCVVNDNHMLVPVVKENDTPEWEPRTGLATHAESYGTVFANNDIYLGGTAANTGIKSRGRNDVIMGNRIYGGHYASVDMPYTQMGLELCGPGTIAEHNFIDRCGFGVYATTHSEDYQAYCTNQMIGKNTITNCRFPGIVLRGDGAHVYQNKFRNCAYGSGVTPLRTKSLIQLGSTITRTVSSIAGDTITLTGAHTAYRTAQVRFRSTNTLPTGLTEGTYYWVVSETEGTADIQVSATKEGSAISPTGGSGTHYMDQSALPPKDCVIEGNIGDKGSNDSFIACLGIDTDEITVVGNTALGYGDDTTIFDDTFDEAADMQAAWQNRNEVDSANATFNVLDYGADATGAADSTTAIQAALTAAGALTYGGTVTLPPGEYEISAKVTIPERVTLAGAGRESSRITAAVGSFSGATDVMVEFSKRTQLRNFMVIGPSTSAGAGISNKTSETTWGVTLDNVKCGTLQSGFYFDGVSWGIHLNNCYAHTCDDGIKVESAGSANCNALLVTHGEYTACDRGMSLSGLMSNTTIHGAIVQNNTSYGIVGDTFPTKKQMTIRHCYFEDNGNSHVYVNGRTNGLVVDSNYFSATSDTTNCVLLTPHTGSSLHCYDTLISNNVSVARDDGDGSERDYVISNANAHRTVIRDNTYSKVASTTIFYPVAADRITDSGTDTKIANTTGGTDEITATDAGVAASATTLRTEVTTNGDSDLDNVTLADGYAGQVKHIYCVVEGNAADTWKITPATMCGGTRITFAGVGEGCTMVFADSEGWVVIANNGGTIT